MEQNKEPRNRPIWILSTDKRQKITQWSKDCVFLLLLLVVWILFSAFISNTRQYYSSGSLKEQLVDIALSTGMSWILRASAFPVLAVGGRTGATSLKKRTWVSESHQRLWLGLWARSGVTVARSSLLSTAASQSPFVLKLLQADAETSTRLSHRLTWVSAVSSVHEWAKPSEWLLEQEAFSVLPVHIERIETGKC